MGSCYGSNSRPSRLRRAIHHRTGEYSGLEKRPNQGDDDPASR